MLHLVDLALSEKPLFQTSLPLPLEAFPGPEDRKANFCVIGKIPRDKVPNILEGKVEIFTLVLDSAENIVALLREKEDSPRLKEKNLYYYSFFSLPPGEYACRFIIRNLETGRGAIGVSRATILERKEKAIELYPPLFALSDKNAVYRRGPPPKKLDSNFANLSLSNYFFFDGAQYSPSIEEGWAKNSTVPAVAVCSIFPFQLPRLKFPLIFWITQREKVFLLMFLSFPRKKKEK